MSLSMWSMCEVTSEVAPESVGSPFGRVVSKLSPNSQLSFLVGRKNEEQMWPNFLKGKFLVLFDFEAFEVS